MTVDCRSRIVRAWDLPSHGPDMSSKKARRRARRKREREEQRRSKMNPATRFILGIALAIVLTLVWGFVFGDFGPGEPPWPGAVWSPLHGHWH